MSGLDDFFAKKDRKKGKSGKKFSTPEEVAKKIDDTKQKTELKGRPPREGEEGLTTHMQHQGEEDEWREYDEVAKKDYTGLKIQPLAANESDQGGNGGGGSQGSDGGTGGQQSGGPGGQNKPSAWNKANASGAPATAPPEKVKEAPPIPPPVAPPVSGGYVAPGLRKLQQSGGTTDPVKRGQKVSAPDINNKDYFPSLGGERKGGNNGGDPWTEAGGGGRSRAPPSGLQPPREVPLGNRFTSLTNDS